MEIIPTVAVLIIKDKSVLLVQHGEGASHITGIFGLPGGRVDLGESEKEAATRELAEETGLVAKNLQEFPNNTYIATIQRKNGVGRFSWKVFLCSEYSGTLKNSSETVPTWIEISKVSTYKLLPNTEKVIEEALTFLDKH